MMKVDKKTLEMLSRMPDERLWHTLCLVASGMGAELSERKRCRIVSVERDEVRFCKEV